MATYYNEIDPQAAQWLRNLIAAGHLPDGDVDTRSIEDVHPHEIRGYTQAHFFAGIGGWPLALRLAGWPDDRPVWTGSCPCFPADTLIFTQRGHLPIQDVTTGDTVLTHRARWRRVTHVGSEVSEVVRVRGQGHYGLICTPDHPFLTGEEEWTAAKDLRKRRWRTVARVPENPEAIPWTPPERGVLFDRGSWRACGSKGNKTTYLGRFATRSEAVNERLKAEAEGRISTRGADSVDPATAGFARFLGYWLGDGWATEKGVVAICGGHEDSELLKEIMDGAGITGSVTKERTGTRARCGSQYLSGWLREQFGTSAENKRVPTWLHAMPPGYREAFLQGYWEADGHSEPKVRRWTTVSHTVAIAVRILLNQQGASATVTFHKPKRKTVIEGRQVNERGLYRVTAYENARSFNFSEDHGNGYVRSVEPAGTARVYNLAVEEDESYCADGIVVHNCQPFSAAGARAGFDDERHLWPAWYWLIEQCRPPVVFGEQVASKAADDWLDLVQADLEALDYALGAVPFPSASVGAPHIRDRLYWVANALGHRLQGRLSRRADSERETVDGSSGRGSATGGLADASCDGRSAGTEPGLHNAEHHTEPCCGAGGSASPLHGFWRDADWLACRDGKWRPVEPGTSPLVDGVPARVVRLRAYGNAINVQQAAEFVRCTTDSD